MLSVAEATQRILGVFAPLTGEVIGIDRALGRIE